MNRELFSPISATAIAVGAMLASTSMDVLAKFASPNMDVWQLVALRWGFSIIFLVLLARKWTNLAFRTADRNIHLIRALLNLVGSASLFYALSVLPLPNVISIFFAEPVIAMIFARIFLNEQVSYVKWSGVILSLFGIVFITRIGTGGVYIYDSLVALLGASAWGLMHVLTKKSGSNADISSLMLWLAVFTTCAAAPFAYINWVPITFLDLSLIVCISGLGCVYGYLWIKGIRLASVSLMVTVSYLSLPLAYAFGWLLFENPIEPDTILGSSIILTGVTMATIKWRAWKISSIQ